MTKAEIVDSVYSGAKLTKKDSAQIVELVLQAMKDALNRGEKVKISRFGIFEVHGKESRVGRDPRSGKAIEISARRVLKFHVSRKLKLALNSERPAADSGVEARP